MPRANTNRKIARTCDGMRKEYDFTTGAVTGKYAARYDRMRLKVTLDPEVARAFPDSTAVNEALRTLMRLRATTTRRPRPKQRKSDARQSRAA